MKILLRTPTDGCHSSAAPDADNADEAEGRPAQVGRPQGNLRQAGRDALPIDARAQLGSMPTALTAAAKTLGVSYQSRTARRLKMCGRTLRLTMTMTAV